MKAGIYFLCFILLSSCNILSKFNDRPLVKTGRVIATNDSTGTPIYEKEWKNKKRHGIWRDYYEDGKVKEEYVYNEGIPMGTWKSFYPDGKMKTRGAFVDGKESGLWEEWHHNGQLSFQGQYENGLAQGVATTWNDKGDIIEEIMWEKGEIQRKEPPNISY
ncbi:MAG: toxin-antitoxin system YwqK family antitoxin [Oligoflexia bacterium]|nr:toxin-antitoxin system YwqK family antitoxin [Oligoflexia bacterium]